MSESCMRFTILGEKHFVDNLIYNTLDGQRYQLEWLLLNDMNSRLPQEECAKLAAASDLYSGGWTLSDYPPDFLTVAVYDNPETAVHPELRDILPKGLYWTGCVDPSDSSYAYYVSLSYGYVNWYYRYSGGLALACRRVSPRQ